MFGITSAFLRTGSRSLVQPSRFYSQNRETIQKTNKLFFAVAIYAVGFVATMGIYADKRKEWIEYSFINTPYANDITPWGSFPNRNFPSPYVRESHRSRWKCPAVALAWPVTIVPVIMMNPHEPFNKPLTNWLFY